MVRACKRTLTRFAVGATLAAVALAVAGCTDAEVASSTSAAVAHESAARQVITTCVDNIFYNGLLPKAPAEAECVQCVVNALGQLGFHQASGESANAMIANVRLTAKQSSELNFACNETDVAD
jgi:hypothetical protein